MPGGRALWLLRSEESLRLRMTVQVFHQHDAAPGMALKAPGADPAVSVLVLPRFCL
jgi:hypothetical protein